MSRTQLGIVLSTLTFASALAFAFVRPGASRGSALAQGVAAPPLQVERGQAVYQARCEVCHGAEGDGNGPAALSMDPRPRDFRRGWYKIRTTTSGQLPTDEDLVRIIAEGMPGTTMPAWKDVLTDEEIRSVVLYIKGFAKRFERETPTLVDVAGKVNASAESIDRGRELFLGEAAECAKCHGLAGRGDGPSADELTEDFFGDVIVPADLTMPWLFRGGPTVDDIYMRLKTGLTGSPMPSYAAVLSDEQLWDLANYVDSLGPDSPPALEAAFAGVRIDGAIPDDPSAEAWQNAPEFYVPLGGQIMREPRNETPSVQGIWLRALYNQNELALLLRWHDRFEDRGAAGGVPDALAVQFPAALSTGDQRPYFVLGDSAKPVNLWYWSAATNTVEERTGRGVGSVTAQTVQNVQGAASFSDGEYSLIVRRALRTADPDDVQFESGVFIPLAFMAWDGWRGEQEAAGALTTWYMLFLEQPTPVINFVWIPVAVIAVAIVEGLIVWGVRRANRETSDA